MSQKDSRPPGLIARIVELFITSKLSILFIIFAMAMGAAAVLMTPREEEPQIVVPLADVYVNAPGASAEEVEKLVATPLERLLWQIDGVEYVYSVSRRDMAIVTVRFYVGEDRERSLVKLYNKISMNMDQAPPLVRNWLIRPVEIDDVPIVNLTLYSRRYNDHELRRIGEEVLARLARVPDISRTYIVGGRSREVRVALSPDRMAGLGVSMLDVWRALKGPMRPLRRVNSIAETGPYPSPVIPSWLRPDMWPIWWFPHMRGGPCIFGISQITDGPEEPTTYTRFSLSNAKSKTGTKRC
jgi:multidrug efflux pump subunit AcrB